MKQVLLFILATILVGNISGLCAVDEIQEQIVNEDLQVVRAELKAFDSRKTTLIKALQHARLNHSTQLIQLNTALLQVLRQEIAAYKVNLISGQANNSCARYIKQIDVALNPPIIVSLTPKRLFN